MSMLRITVGSLEFTARMEEENAPKTYGESRRDITNIHE